MMSPKDVDDTDNIVIYGPSGTGKTTIASTYPKPLHLDIGEKTSDVLKKIKGLKTMSIETCEDIEELYWWFVDNPGKFKSVIFDTVSRLQDIRVKAVVKAKKKKAKIKGDPGAWGTMTKGDWGDVSSWMKTWLTNFRDLPDVKGVFIAQDRVNKEDNNEDEEGNILIMPEVGPALQPATAKALNAAVNIIGNTFIRETTKRRRIGKRTKEIRKIEYCMRLGPSAVYRTKVRNDIEDFIPSFIVNPTYESIKAVKQGELKNGKKKKRKRSKG